jgi:hypothetical protein
VKPTLTDMSNAALVQRFAEICVAQDEASDVGDLSKFRKLYKQESEINAELKSRGTDARLGLLRLYEHSNMQVRLEAAKATLAVAPDEARRMIEAIAGGHKMPQAGEAGMTLWNLDRGVFKPT